MRQFIFLTALAAFVATSPAHAVRNGASSGTTIRVVQDGTGPVSCMHVTKVALGVEDQKEIEIELKIGTFGMPGTPGLQGVVGVKSFLRDGSKTDKPILRPISIDNISISTNNLQQRFLPTPSLVRTRPGEAGWAPDPIAIRRMDGEGVRQKTVRIISFKNLDDGERYDIRFAFEIKEAEDKESFAGCTRELVGRFGQ
jgi:hypothetical protein